MAKVEDEIRFRKARPSDHLCSPFQYSNCQSQNICGRDLVFGDVQDEAFDSLAIQVSLDAFLSHASRTVSSHRTEVLFSCKYFRALESTHSFPRLGPFPLGHYLGMLQTFMLELRALKPGRKGMVTWGTTCHQQATYNLLWETFPESREDITLSSLSKRGRFVATCNPTEGRCFQRLTIGINARIGEVVNQEREYTFQVLFKLIHM